MTTKENIIKIVANSIQAKGYNATGINDIIALAGIPKGSLYHHFPGGKDELVIEALHLVKDHMSQRFVKAMKGKTTAETGLKAVIDDYISYLTNTGFKSGCPMATVALEVSGSNENIRLACNEVLDFWINSLVQYFKYKQINAGKKEATEFMTRLEGALMIAKIQHSDKPLKILKNQLKDFIKF